MPEQSKKKSPEESKKGTSGSKTSGGKGKDKNKSKKDSKKSKASKKVLAAVMIRGNVGAGPDAKKTLRDLKLHGKNNAVFVEDTPGARGMLRKVKDYVTWGPVDEKIKDDLKHREDNGVYRMHPPKGGMGSVKNPHKRGGALGERDDMKELLVKMK